MKNIVIKWSCLCLLLVSVAAKAQDPNWFVDSNNYEFQMTFIGFLTIDGNRLTSENDKMAFFVDDVCRGTANLQYVESADAYYVFATAFSNTSNEVMEVRIYDSASDSVRISETTETFLINEHKGTLFQATSWADPVLNMDAEIVDFGVSGITSVSLNINANQVFVVLPNNTDLSALQPTYTLSSGAQLFREGVLQSSGVETIDFTNPVSYQVRSEDQSALEDWTVTITVEETAVNQYFKRDAVCYQNGAIKVVSSLSQFEVILLDTDGTQIASTVLENGEATFEDIAPATYTVRIQDQDKSITINTVD